MGTVIPISATAERLTRWLSDFRVPYKPLMTELSDHFRTLFYLQHIGAGRMAIEAWHQGVGLQITDADQPLSAYADRIPGETGYAVGIYAIETYQMEWPPGVWQKVTDLSEEPIGWASSPVADSAEQLTWLIELALGSVSTFDPEQEVPYEHVPDYLMIQDESWAAIKAMK